jgi:hypothetical protein
LTGESQITTAASVDQGNVSNLTNLYRLRLGGEKFELEKGDLREGRTIFTSVTQGQLPFQFKPFIIVSKEAVEQLHQFLKSSLLNWIQPENRLVLVIPENWGLTFKLPHPGKIDEEELAQHLHWVTALNGWEDDEAVIMNYQALDNELIMISALRERICNYLTTLSEGLSFQLAEVALDNNLHLNLIASEGMILSGAKKAIPSTPVPDKIKDIPLPETTIPAEVAVTELVAEVQPVEEAEPAIEEDFFKPKKIPLFIALPLIIAVFAGGYFVVGRIFKNVRSPSSHTVKLKKEILPVKTDSVALKSNVVSKTEDRGEIRFFSVNETAVKCEIALASREGLNGIEAKLRELNVVDSVRAIKSTQAGNSSITLINIDLVKEVREWYQQPIDDRILKIMQERGFVLSNSVLSGSIEDIDRFVSFIDENGLLFYRLVISERKPEIYYLSLDY